MIIVFGRKDVTDLKNGRGKCWKKTAVFVTLLVGVFFSAMQSNGRGDKRNEEAVSTGSAGENTVLVGGMPVGIYMETDGILVLDTQEIEGEDGEKYEPARHLVHAGDYIVGINERAVECKKDLTEELADLKQEEVVLKLRRGTEELEVKMDAVKCAGSDHKLGIWIRDNVQGLGTITFLTGNSKFGALGHGIHDADTSVLMDIGGGSLYKTSIRSILKGENGMPGSMEGMIVYNRYNRLGTVEKNTEMGIYGTIEEIDALFEEQIPVQVAEKEEIHTGDAAIRCCLGEEVREYGIQITEVDPNAKEENKGIVLEVTDPELLDETGGIIQGMSGSPILQDGKLIGAVTHVFVNDPTKGYGIFAETMLETVCDGQES